MINTIACNHAVDNPYRTSSRCESCIQEATIIRNSCTRVIIVCLLALSPILQLELIIFNFMTLFTFDFQVLKMYAWEPSFQDQILKIRNKEMQVLKQTAYLNSATSFIWSCAPFLVSDKTSTNTIYTYYHNICNFIT